MIAVCVKWLEDAEGISAADQAALELALRHAEQVADTVTALTVGPPAAARGLREALAAGATGAVHLVTDGPTPSREAAAALAGQLGNASAVWCGDASADRGSATVPAFLAEFLGVQQALGVISAEVTAVPLTVIRRLDGGRREVLKVAGRAVISVEGAAARLRRAGLRSQLAARQTDVVVVPGQQSTAAEPPLIPYRPRPQQLAAPTGDSALARIGTLLHGGAPHKRGELVELGPTAAAGRIVQALTEWGYLEAVPVE